MAAEAWAEERERVAIAVIVYLEERRGSKRGGMRAVDAHLPEAGDKPITPSLMGDIVQERSSRGVACLVRSSDLFCSLTATFYTVAGIVAHNGI